MRVPAIIINQRARREKEKEGKEKMGVIIIIITGLEVMFLPFLRC
jgi:hypothetical protein